MKKSNIILGTAQLINGYGINKSNISDNELKKILFYAEKNHIKYIDTAYEYKNVHKRLGKQNLNAFKIITKIPKIKSIQTDDIYDEIIKIIEHSLYQLNIKKIDTILIHNLEDLENINKISLIIKALSKLKKERFINKIGLSIYSPKIFENLKELSDIDVIQSPLNLIDQRLIDSGLLNRLVNEKIEINVRSIFLQGLLLKSDKDYLIKNFNRWNKIWEIWFDFINNSKNEFSPLQTCIDFIRNISGINKVVVGVNSYNDLEKILLFFEDEPIVNFPDIKSNDENLIYPYNWKHNVY